MLLFDIQTPQLAQVKSKVSEKKMRILQEVPIVTIQLNEINGIDKKENEEKGSSEIQTATFGECMDINQFSSVEQALHRYEENQSNDMNESILLLG